MLAGADTMIGITDKMTHMVAGNQSAISHPWDQPTTISHHRRRSFHSHGRSFHSHGPFFHSSTSNTTLKCSHLIRRDLALYARIYPSNTALPEYSFRNRQGKLLNGNSLHLGLFLLLLFLFLGLECSSQGSLFFDSC